MLRPDLEAESLADVSLDVLQARGIRGIIIDLDNTVCAYGQSTLAPGVRAWVHDAKARGFAIAMVSNNFSDRVEAIGAELGVPGVHSALKPLPHGFLQALRLIGTKRAQTAIIGDQLFTDVLGAKLLGLHTVLTHPIVERDFPITRILRFFERAVFARKPRA
jgi:HAD superfamily phosphatase (TIGR01668 family)